MGHPGHRHAWMDATRVARSFAYELGEIPVAVQVPSTVPRGDDTSFAAVARYAVGLAMTREWVNRRNETFTFIDANTVRRQMSVDFTLLHDSSLSPGDMVLVPIMLLEKKDLRNLDVRDEAGSALPVLTTQQNGATARVGLREMLQAKDGDSVDAALKDIVLSDWGNPVASNHLVTGSPIRRASSCLKPKRRNRLETLLRELDKAFMLLVAFEYWPGQRHVCKLSYDAAIKPQRSKPPGPPLGGARFRSAYVRFNRIGSSLGLFGRLEHFTDLAVGLGTSYHAEVVPAPDTYVAEAALWVQRAGTAIPEEPVQDDHAFRPHLRATPSSRSDTGRLSLTVHARREELIVPLCFSSFVISAVLAYVPQHANTLEGQTLAALLLLPFALSAFYVRSAENSYASRMLVGVRALAALPVAAGALVIGLVAAGRLPPEPGHSAGADELDIARVAFLIAAVPTAVLIAVLFVPLGGRLLRHRLRAKQEQIRTEARKAEREQRTRKLRLSIPAIVTIALASLLACAGILFGGYRLTSNWWESAKPSAPRPIVKTPWHL
jgi:hypothetical protein